MHELNLRMAPDAVALASLAEAVEGFAAAARLPPVTAHRLAVICDELVANVGSHGNEPTRAATFVAIRATRGEQRVDLLVEDDGAMFDPLSLPPPDTTIALENRAIGGLGIHLVRSFAQDMRYERRDGLNRFHLVLKVPEPLKRSACMQVIATDKGGPSLATLNGRLDTVTAPELERPLLDLVASGNVVLDLAAVSYVSSAGLRVLLKAAKAARAAGHGFVLCGMQPSVSEVYEIGGFERIISAYPDRTAALASLA